jgi:hypothetical protein
MEWSGLSDMPVLFDYEYSSSENLTFMPMIVRFHLDRIGQRISLQQWQLLPMADREWLARFPPDEDAGLDAHFKAALATMMGTHADAEPEPIAIDPSPAWRDTEHVPDTLTRHCGPLGLTPPSAARWAALTPLQRYVLSKLTRKPQASHDLLPAWREFSLDQP